MAKEIKKIVKLHISAGQATPAPPVGPALATQGINLSQFCQAFNDQTKEQSGWIIPVVVTVYEDASFEFVVKQPPASALLKKAAGIEKGSGEVLKGKAGKITKAQLEEIAKRKMEDLNTDDLEKAMKILEGTARSIGIVVE